MHPKKYLWLGVPVALLSLPLVVKGIYVLHVINLTILYIIATCSFRTIMLSGQFPLAHGAFMAIGAYVSGCLSKWLGWSPWICIPLGALSAALIGIVIGYPFARLRTLYYAMISLFFGMLVVSAIEGLPLITGGESGLIGIPPLLGFSKHNYYYFFLLIGALSLLLLYRMEHSRIGLTWLAIAQSPLVAQSVGINERFYRVFALAVGSFFAGFSGSLYAHYMLVISPANLGLMASLMFLLYIVVGGMRNFWGPVLGVALLRAIPELFRMAGEFVPYISASLLLVMAYSRRDGIMEVFRILIKHITSREREVKNVA